MFEPVELFETLMRVAKGVGDIDSAHLIPPDEYSPSHCIRIAGVSKSGGKFELEFEMSPQKETTDA